MTFKCQRNVCATFAVFNDWQINLVFGFGSDSSSEFGFGLGHGLGVSLCLHKVQHLLVVVVCLLLSLLICTCRRPRIPASWHLSNRCRSLHRGTSQRRSKPLNTWQINICSHWGRRGSSSKRSRLNRGSVDKLHKCMRMGICICVELRELLLLRVDVACYFGQVIAICCCHCCCCPNTQHWSVKNIPMSGISNLSLSHASPLPSAPTTTWFTCLQQQSTPLFLSIDNHVSIRYKRLRLQQSVAGKHLHNLTLRRLI